jgi:hypothetical protein
MKSPKSQTTQPGAFVMTASRNGRVHRQDEQRERHGKKRGCREPVSAHDHDTVDNQCQRRNDWKEKNKKDERRDHPLLPIAHEQYERGNENEQQQVDGVSKLPGLAMIGHKKERPEHDDR